MERMGPCGSIERGGGIGGDLLGPECKERHIEFKDIRGVEGGEHNVNPCGVSM